MIDDGIVSVSLMSTFVFTISVTLNVVRYGSISVTIVITVTVVCMGSFGVMASLVVGDSVTFAMFGVDALMDDGVMNWGLVMDGGLVTLSGGFVVINILVMGVSNGLVLMIRLIAEWVMILVLVMSVVRVVLSCSMVTLIRVHVTVVMAINRLNTTVALGGVVVAVVVTVGVFVSVILAMVNCSSEVLGGDILIEIVALFEIAVDGRVMALVVLLEYVMSGSVGGESLVMTLSGVAVIAVINVLVRLNSLVVHGNLIGFVRNLFVVNDWLVINNTFVMHCGVVMVYWLVMATEVGVITVVGSVVLSVVTVFIRGLLVVKVSIVVRSSMMGLVVGIFHSIRTMFISILGAGNSNDCSKNE